MVEIHSRTIQLLKKSPLGGRSELINLTLPVVFLTAAIVEIIVKPAFGNTQLMYLNIAVELIFFNAFHALFTLLFFMNHIEFKNFVTLKSAQIKPSLAIWLAVIFVFFVCASVILFLNTHLNSQTTILAIIMAKSAIFYRIHHSVSQNVGISLLYYSAFHRSIESRKKLKVCFFLEKLFLPAVFFVCLVAMLGLMFFDLQYKILILACSFLIILFLISTVTFNAHKYAGVEFSRLRLLFMLRYLLYPLIFISHWAAVGVSAIHGIEYFFLNNKINNSCKIKMFEKANLSFYLTGLLFMTSSLAMVIYSASNSQIKEPYSYLFFGAFVCFQSMSFMHFFIDRFIFKFKDPLVQSTIGSIFFDQSSEKI